ncbi:pre-mrna splicing factor [Holotrichia oblita]|uniref:Pre-mrna splicing factor n=1 Tax=Holotrichia oblita TaxID=644536 RepID=A0ACB9THB3_HOLOL|nr:pre-mrna splicing factor [Holotrichia oblita]
MPTSEENQPEIIFTDEDLPYEEEILRNPYRTRRRQIKGRCIIDPGYEEVNNAFERALVFMHKMPRIWMDYCSFLTDQCKITRTRKVFDRALRALPITQHHRIWPLYLSFMKKHNIPETAVRVFRRYLKLYEAAVQLAKIVNNENFVSQDGKSNHQLWNELCDLISQNPDSVHSLNVDAIIRLFDRARDIYEEAIQTVTTVRDFTQIFDAYAQFEELSLSKRMEEIAKLATPTEEDDIDLELRLARFENLMERRLLLLNSVLLRQNPHNVQEWHKRVKLYEGKPHDIINTYTEAVQTVDPKSAVGKLHTLWVEFAKFYENNGQVDDARLIFEKSYSSTIR